MGKYLISLALSAALTVSAVAGEADQLLKRWCDGLIALQVTEFARRELKGAVQCPACGLLHGRICDVAYPFAHLYATTGDRRYLDAAEAALDWCEANMLLPDGLYRNDRQTYWRSTTAFFAISLWKALAAYGEKLPPETRAKWRKIFLRSAAGAYRLYEEKTDGFSPVINYHCVYPELMHLAWKETGEEKYLAAAKRQAEFLKATAFNAEGFLVGEGKVNGELNGVTAQGCSAIDLGYNLEESLTALIEYADLAGDAELRALAVKSAKLQLEFVLPDGAIDNSCGSRSVKWTYYGSRTSDGILTLLTLLRNDIPYAAEMARRVVNLYARCTGADGLIAGGLMYAEAGEPACVHHAFARAKTLVDYVRSGLVDGPAAPLPREAASGARHFRSLNAYLAAVGPWRATFSGNDGFNLNRSAAVSGGTLSMLWHPALGPVSVATLGSFFYAEPHNMQDDRHDMKMRCLAPRLVKERFSNIFDFEAKTGGDFRDGVFTYEAKGKLTHDRGYKGADYALGYRLDSTSLAISVKSSDPEARFVWPLVADKTDKVTVEGNVATVVRCGKTLRLEASAPISIDASSRGDRIWSPVAGLLCVPFSVPADKPVTLKLSCN